MLYIGNVAPLELLVDTVALELTESQLHLSVFLLQSETHDHTSITLVLLVVESQSGYGLRLQLSGVVIIYLSQDVSLGSLGHNIVLQDIESSFKEPHRISLKAVVDDLLFELALACVLIQGF